MGVPPKITTGDLPGMGFRSNNDRPLVKILSFLGFIDGNHSPTDRYKDSRLKEKSKSVMASALKSSYSELFTLYLDAHKLDKTTLRDFFASKTDAGEQVVARTVDTFMALCEFADFEAPAVIPRPGPTPTPRPGGARKPSSEGQGLS